MSSLIDDRMLTASSIVYRPSSKNWSEIEPWVSGVIAERRDRGCADLRAEAQRILQAVAAQPAGQEPGVEAVTRANRVDHALDQCGRRVERRAIRQREGAALGALQHHHAR